LAISRTNKQRKKAAAGFFKRLFTAMVIVAVIVTAFRLYDFITTNDRFAVDEVVFAGVERLDESELRRLVHDLEGQNIVLVPIDSYRERVENHPRVRFVHMKRVLPSRIVCTVTEREPVALVYASEFLEVDREGIIMPEDDLTSALDLPIISGIGREEMREGQPCRNDGLEGALRALEYCKTHGDGFARDISEIRLGKTGMSIVSLKDQSIILVSELDVERHLKKYFLMRDTITENNDSLKLIDLRFDDQIVLRSRLRPEER